MKMSRGGSYLKAKDAKDEQIIMFLDAGRKEQSDKFKYPDGNPMIMDIFKVEYKGEQKEFKLNKASRVAMIDAFGDESTNWIGKKAKIFVMPTPNGNDKMMVLKPIVDKQSEKEAWDE